MEIANVPKNAKYIGYKCVVCESEIAENERQLIISLGFVQTWCMRCAILKFPDDKRLSNYFATNGGDDTILLRNKLLNNEK